MSGNFHHICCRDRQFQGPALFVTLNVTILVFLVNQKDKNSRVFFLSRFWYPFLCIFSRVTSRMAVDLKVMLISKKTDECFAYSEVDPGLISITWVILLPSAVTP